MGVAMPVPAMPSYFDFAPVFADEVRPAHVIHAPARLPCMGLLERLFNLVTILQLLSRSHFIPHATGERPLLQGAVQRQAGVVQGPGERLLVLEHC